MHQTYSSHFRSSAGVHTKLRSSASGRSHQCARRLRVASALATHGALYLADHCTQGQQPRHSCAPPRLGIFRRSRSTVCCVLSVQDDKNDIKRPSVVAVLCVAARVLTVLRVYTTAYRLQHIVLARDTHGSRLTGGGRAAARGQRPRPECPCLPTPTSWRRLQAHSATAQQSVHAVRAVPGRGGAWEVRRTDSSSSFSCACRRRGARTLSFCRMAPSKSFDSIAAAEASPPPLATSQSSILS